MAVGVYMDVHIHSAITIGLRLRGVDVLTAQEDGASRFLDRDLLTRASMLRMVLYTNDDDFLKEAHRRRSKGEAFFGIAYSQQLRSPIHECVEDLEIIAKALDPTEVNCHIEYVPF